MLLQLPISHLFHVLRINVPQPLAFQQFFSTGPLEKQAAVTPTTTGIIALALLPCFSCSLNHEYHYHEHQTSLRNQYSLIRHSKCVPIQFCVPLSHVRAGPHKPLLPLHSPLGQTFPVRALGLGRRFELSIPAAGGSLMLAERFTI